MEIRGFLKSLIGLSSKAINIMFCLGKLDFTTTFLLLPYWQITSAI